VHYTRADMVDSLAALAGARYFLFPFYLLSTSFSYVYIPGPGYRLGWIFLCVADLCQSRANKSAHLGVS